MRILSVLLTTISLASLGRAITRGGTSSIVIRLGDVAYYMHQVPEVWQYCALSEYWAFLANMLILLHTHSMVRQLKVFRSKSLALYLISEVRSLD